MKFVVTAGPTREYLDPVRFLSNPSTGKMGFAVARAAAMRGHEVALVAGPVSLKTPKGVRRIDVTSARDMLAAVERELSQQAPGTVFVSTAAVADWRPAKCASRKLKKGQMSDTLKLVRNPDILKEIGRRTKIAHSPTHPLANLSCGFCRGDERRRRGSAAQVPREEPRHDCRERRHGEGLWLWRRHQSCDFS